MKLSKFKKILEIFFLFLPLFVLAQENVLVSPAIIDEKAQPGFLLSFSVTIENKTNSLVWIYPIVMDILPEGGRDFPKKTFPERTESLGSWVSITRGRIEILSQKKVSVPLSIKVDPGAKPGVYYGVIIFAKGHDYYEAEKNALFLREPELLLRFQVEENIVEKAEIKTFKTEKRLYIKTPIKFLLEIKNIGNREIIPQGNIFIYDRNQKEVGNLEINPQKTKIEPQKSKVFEVEWRKEGSFGKYKAVLNAEYGQKTKRDLQDTIYFSILSWQFLLFLSLFFLTLVILLIWLIFKIKKIEKE